MKAIRKKPGCAPEIIEVENTLEALQQEVGGYIETLSIADVVIICNEEGRLCGLPSVRPAVQLPVRRRGFCRHDPRGRP